MNNGEILTAIGHECVDAKTRVFGSKIGSRIILKELLVYIYLRQTAEPHASPGKVLGSKDSHWYL